MVPDWYASYRPILDILLSNIRSKVLPFGCGLQLPYFNIISSYSATTSLIMLLLLDIVEKLLLLLNIVENIKTISYLLVIDIYIYIYTLTKI